MIKAQAKLTRFSVILWLMLAVLLVLIACFAAYVRAEKLIDQTNALRLQSVLLADELRQSSDDLNLMARTYVATGNPRFKRHFQEILDIRDGKSPRPVDYHEAYWNLVLASDQRPDAFGPAVALADLLRQTGLTQDELAKLAEAKQKSDDLTRIEFAAMTLYDADTPDKAANRIQAIRMLHDAAYLSAKAGIVRPIADFVRSADERTSKAVDDAKEYALRLRVLLIALGILQLTLLWRARQHLYGILGGTVQELYRHIEHLGSGNFSTPIKVASTQEDSVLGWLAEMQSRLARLDLSRFRMAIEEAPFPIMIFADDGKILSLNRAWTETSGYALQDIPTLQDWLRQAYGPDEQAAVAAEVARFFREKQRKAHGDYVIRCKDGSTRLWEFSSILMDAMPDGRNLAISMAIDITERRHAEADMRLLSEITRKAAQGVNLVKMSDGTLIYTNPVFNAMFGYAEGELIGKPISSVNAPSDRTPRQITAEIMAALARDGIWSGELLNIRKDGSTFWTSASVSRFEHEELGSLLITHQTDITSRKNSELELRKLNDQLEQRIAERTHELAAAKDTAETANRAKSAFLANMSHEIRTPMNGILGMSHLLRREGLTPGQTERLDKLDKAAEHLLSVINDILDISKIEAGKFSLEDVPLNLNGMLANVGSIIAERARAKNLQILIETEHLPHNLYGDPTRLQQALLNYATNAVKFTESGSLTLRALRQAESEQALLVRFEVEDTGIGIPAETLTRLFSAFEQADNSITRKYGGTGLGLAITRRLAELMGGEAGARSTPGRGSTFWFTASFKKGNEVLSKEAQKIAGRAEVLRRCTGRRILVVDDEPVNQEIAKLLLEDVGGIVDTADDGAQAIAMALQTTYTLILMDMQMPNVNGLEAAQKLRTMPEHRDTPIIAVTANAFAEDKARCFEAGMNEVIIKPFNPESVYACLMKFLPVGTILATPEKDDQEARSAPSEQQSPVRDAAEAAVLQRLAQLPGVNLALALDELGGQSERYLKLLALFVESHFEDMARLHASLARNDQKEALHLTHTLAGAAAILRLRRIAEIARRMEIRLRHDSEVAGPASVENNSSPDDLCNAFGPDMDAISLELAALNRALSPAGSTQAQ